MTQDGEHFVTSASGTAFLWLAVLLISVSITGLQGCRQLEEGTGGTASADRGQTSFYDQLPGCWKLRVTAQGAQRDSLRSWLPEGALPSVIELDTTLAESVGSDSVNSDSVYKARSHGGYPGRSFSVWRYTRGDSIRVQRKGALAGTMLELKPTREKLVGSVVVFTDARGIGQGRPLRSGEFRRRGAVEAVPARCPAK